ncbi:hypothetical protein D3C76_1563950 [compost metagenome]
MPAVDGQKAFILQDGIGLIDSHHIHAELLRQLPDSRKSLSVLQLSFTNRNDYGISQLDIDRGIALEIQGKDHGVPSGDSVLFVLQYIIQIILNSRNSPQAFFLASDNKNPGLVGPGHE